MTNKPKPVIKPTEAESRLLILAGDVLYHVHRYVRSKVIKSVIHPHKPLHKQKVEAAHDMALSQARALVKHLETL